MSDNQHPVVTLRSGIQVSAPLVNVIMLRLKRLIEDDPIGFYEFVTLCRNPSHTLWGRYEKKFKDSSLIESNGQPHQTIKEIVLDAVVGEDLQMRLQSPIKPD